MTVLGARRTREEILDRRGQDADELARSLRHVSAVNRWLGGDRSLLLHLRPLLGEVDRSLRLLDVGVGDARLLRRLGKKLVEPVDLVGVDLHPGIVRIARDRDRGRSPVRLVRADGLRLPFADDAFDAALASLTLHHFPDDEASRLLREMARVSRLRILVSDLERCVANYAGARVLAWTAWRRNRITRHDGPLSVLRSFTPEELRHLARESGLRKPRVRRRFPFRLVLEALPPSVPGSTARAS